MWAGFDAVRYNNQRRGPTGAEGAIEDELRGAGWVVRNRAEAAFAAPDDAPEKAFFSRLVIDAIARWEGGFRITGTPLDADPLKAFGQNLGNFYSGAQLSNLGPMSGHPPVLHNWESNGNPLKPDANATIAYNVKQRIWQAGEAGSFTSPWMQYYTLYALARVLELGFPAKALMVYSGQWLTDMLLHSGEPRLSALYQHPVERAGGGSMTWDEVRSKGFTSDYLTNGMPGYFARQLQPDGRAAWMTPGLAALVNLKTPDAPAAWAWFHANVYNKIDFATDPRWAILPRQ